MSRDDAQVWSLRAGWLLPVEGEPIRDGVLTIAGERIVAIGSRAEGSTLDLGDSIVVPGLVNAHAHLEFSGLTRPLGQPGMAFPDWIGQVVAWKRARAANQPAGDVRAAIEQGLAESIAQGVTALGEIATLDAWTNPFARWLEGRFERPDMSVFHESLGFGAGDVPIALATAEARLADDATHSSWTSGVSPHAPYTVHRHLLDRLIELASRRQLPLAMHLAESREEMQLLRDGAGPFAERLAALGLDWSTMGIPPGTRPLDYLRWLSVLPRVLVIHGNYFSTEEIEFLAAHGERMSVVYCPRTHGYFGHARHPLMELLRAGASVALGTDGRASNPDLSLWNEMRYLAREFAELAPAELLRLGTLAGAKALGRRAECGSLVAGKLANLAVFRLPDGDAASNPYESLLAIDKPTGVVLRGRYRAATDFALERRRPPAH